MKCELCGVAIGQNEGNVMLMLDPKDNSDRWFHHACCQKQLLNSSGPLGDTYRKWCVGQPGIEEPIH